MTARDVDEAIIDPMVAIFPPPMHVRGCHEAALLLLDVYRKVLAGYPRAVLEQAWTKVAAENTYWIWPRPADIVQACRQIRARTGRTPMPGCSRPPTWPTRTCGNS